jgi:tetratricopeptide (TPR) repeat protein
MSRASEVTSPETPRLGELCVLASDELRRAHLRAHPELVAAESVDRLAEAVRQEVRIDVTRALHAGDSAILIAELLEDRACLARALRAKGNALWFNGQCGPASELMAQAIRLFEDLGLEDELGRTLSTSIQPLILLGDHEQAMLHAERARDIFSRHQNHLRLARLDINVANIHHRQGHYEEALKVYQRAYHCLLAHRDVEATGVVLHNISVCLIGLDDFEEALRAYHEARHVLETSGMPLLLAQADYNIARLYYLRGDYECALDGLRSTRQIALNAGDEYHAALCDLDQSEIYLDLSLSEEADEMAERAREQFQRLGMRYEMARSLANLAIARSYKHKGREAIELFDQARALFTKEDHRVGEALVDLYQAILLVESGEFSPARQLALQAQQVFQSLRLRRKALVCELLVSRIALSLGELDVAREFCRNVLRQLQEMEAPVLAQRARFLSGLIYEAQHQGELAFTEYEEARRELESVRSSLQREELKIAFMVNKLDVYERLIVLCLCRGAEGKPAQEAFEYMERSKCRSLVDMMFDRTRPVLPRAAGRKTEESIQNLKAKLDWYYHRIDLEELQQEGVSAERVDSLSEKARKCEDALLREIRELPSYGSTGVHTHGSAIVQLEEIRAALAPESVLLQYCQAGDQVLAAVVNRDGVHLVPLAAAQSVQKRMRLLHFQLSKLRLGEPCSASADPVRSHD